MAHIPYGYSVVDGKGVLKPGECGKVKMFICYYLQGASISCAGEKAGIHLSVSALGHILKNPVYLGDGYYPGLINQEVFDKVQEERQERYERLGCFTSNNAIPPVRVQHFFRIKPESETRWLEWPDESKQAMIEPAKKAAYNYARVFADNDGKRQMPAAEQNVMIEWIREHISQTVQG